MRFQKPALSIGDQLARWKRRGLEVTHESEAEHYIRFIGRADGALETVPFRAVTVFCDENIGSARCVIRTWKRSAVIFENYSHD